MYPATPLTRDSFKCQLLLCNAQAPTLATVSWEAETHITAAKIKIHCWDAKIPKQQQQKYTFQYPIPSISASLNSTEFKQYL